VLKKIRVIGPVTSANSLGPTEQTCVAGTRPASEITVVHLERGPASLGPDFEDALAVPDLLNRVQATPGE